MKSIKRGRGPSMMNFVGSVIAVIFGVFWIIATVRMGAPIFFPIFGIIFIAAGVMQAVYNYKNATGKNRYSEYVITENNEEPDPIERYIRDTESREKESAHRGGYCPYCGRETEKEFDFCPSCGRKLPGD